MDRLFRVDWTALLIPTHSVLEIVLRGSVMYLAIFLIFRFLLQRQSGSIGIADLLVVVLIADAASNGFTRTYELVTEGILLVLTIVFWDFLVDWAGYRFKSLGWLLRPPAVLLVENGKVLRRNMRKEMITQQELLSEARKQGLASLSQIKAARLEGNGDISILKRGGGQPTRRARRRIA